MAKTTPFIAQCVIGLALVACGAGDRPAPYMPAPHARTECGELDELVPNLLAFVRAGKFSKFAEMLEEDIVPSGALRNAIGGLLQIVHLAPPPKGLFEPIGQIIATPAFEPLVPLIGNILRYLTGAAPIASEPHYQVTTALGQILVQCDRSGPLLFVEKLASVYLPYGCRPGSNDCLLASKRLVRAGGRLLANPALRDTLGGLRLEAIPQASFVTLLRQVVNVFTSPAFDFANVQQIVESNVYPLISDDALRSELDELLSILEQLTHPETGIQPALVSTLECAEQKDPGEAIFRMLYDIVTDPNVQMAELLGALEGTASADPDDKIAGWVVKVAQVLRENDAAHDAIIGLVGKFLEPQNARRVIPTLLAMGEEGVLDDVSRIIDKGITACSKQPIE